MNKVCLSCTAPYAHSLDKCPNCTATDYVWESELPDGWRALIDSAKTTLDEILSTVTDEKAKGDKGVPFSATHQRPKDSDSTAKWQAYAKGIQLEGVDPEDWVDVDNMKRDELISMFGG